MQNQMGIASVRVAALESSVAKIPALIPLSGAPGISLPVAPAIRHLLYPVNYTREFSDV